MVQVSALMASYNHERYLSQAIESVLNQTIPDLELIIVDDASTDNSPQIIQNYQAKDQRIRAFFHSKNQGIAPTVHQCLNAATGKYVSFIGSDDLWVHSKLEKQLALLQSNEDAVVWSEGDVIDADGKPTGTTFTQMHGATGKRKSGRIFGELICDNYIFGQSVIFSRGFCSQITFKDDLKYLSDYHLVVNLAYKHDFLFIPEALAKYRIHGQNTISRDTEGWLKDRVLLRSYFLEQYGNSLPRRLKGNLYLRIGEALSGLQRRALAKRFYFGAIRINFLSKESILYFSYAFTNGTGLLHKLLLQFYLKLSSLTH